MRLFYLLMLLVLVLGCQSTSEDRTNKYIEKKAFNFSYSQCIKNCSGVAEIEEQRIINDSLLLKFGANLNCLGESMGFSSQYILRHDTLFLEINVNHGKDGSVRLAACNCYYNLQYRIPGITELPKVLIINNQDLSSNTRDSI